MPSRSAYEPVLSSRAASFLIGTLINADLPHTLADRISGDERRLAFPHPEFAHSGLARGAYGSGRPAFRVPEERTATKRTAGGAGIALRFQVGHPWPGAPEHGRYINQRGLRSERVGR